MATVAINYFAYNFIKIHCSLRMSPAMAAGVVDRLSTCPTLWTYWSRLNRQKPPGTDFAASIVPLGGPMIPKTWPTRAITVGAGVGVLACGLAAVAAQQPGGVDAIGSLSALTSEVRLLRQAVEKSTQTQSQVQAMSIHLSAQQNRLNQSAARAEVLRAQLDAATSSVQEQSQKLAELERDTASILNERPDARAQVEGMARTLKAELAQRTQLQADLRGRLAETDASIQADLTGWREMIARLEQLTRP